MQSVAFFILLRASTRIALFFYAHSFLTCIIKHQSILINTCFFPFWTRFFFTIYIYYNLENLYITNSVEHDERKNNRFLSSRETVNK
jgi:hypothetical protein